MLHDQRLPAVHRPRYPPLLPVRHLYEGLGLLWQGLLFFRMEMLWEGTVLPEGVALRNDRLLQHPDRRDRRGVGREHSVCRASSERRTTLDRAGLDDGRRDR